MKETHQHRTYLLFGSNVGNRESHIEQGLKKVKEEAGRPLLISSLYETEAWGVINQEPYLNLAAAIDTALSPGELFSVLKKIERSEGRVNPVKYASRELDIDILFYDNDVIKSDELVIPHPKIHLRKFTLIPLNEIAPGYVHPVMSETIRELLRQCEDDLEVKKYQQGSSII